MKNQIIVFVLVGIALYFLLKKDSMTRIEKIDWLNANVSNGNGQWTKMTDDELTAIYKPLALVKQKVKPDESEYINAIQILKKYGINL